MNSLPEELLFYLSSYLNGWDCVHLSHTWFKNIIFITCYFRPKFLTIFVDVLSFQSNVLFVYSIHLMVEYCHFKRGLLTEHDF